MSAQLGIHEVFNQIRAIAYGIWRKRWYMMIAAWGVCVVGWGLVQTMPYRYASSAQIYVNTETVLPIIARNTGTGVNMRRKIDAVRSTLVRDDNLIKIIRRTDLDRLAQSDKDLRELVNSMKKDVSVRSGRDDIFRIEYENDDSRLSEAERKKVVQAVVASLLEFFTESDLHDRTENILDASNVIDTELQKKAKELDDSERNLAEFRQRNLDFLGGQNRFISKLSNAKDNLKNTRAQLEEMRVELKSKQEQQANVPRYIVEVVGGPRGGSSGSRETGLAKRIADMEKKYDQLKTRGLKDRHPDVRNVRGQLDDLLAQKEAEEKEIAKEVQAMQSGEGITSNRVNRTPSRLYEELTLEIFKKQSEIATLESRVTEQTKTVEVMESNARRIPEIEAEEKGLLRDYNVIKKRYNELLAQKDDLDFAGVVENSEESIAYDIITRPIEPNRPSGPPRFLYLTLTLVGGLGVGLAVALLLSQLRPVILSVEDLRERFNMPVLGNVTILISQDEQMKKRKEMMIFAGAGVGLVAVYMILLMVDALL